MDLQDEIRELMEARSWTMYRLSTYAMLPYQEGSMTFSEKIKVLLAYRNMTMRQLAKKMNISQQCLSAKMQKNSFKEDELVEIASICDATFEGMFTLNESKKKI